jgi:hypothetical protein
MLKSHVLAKSKEYSNERKRVLPRKSVLHATRMVHNNVQPYQVIIYDSGPKDIKSFLKLIVLISMRILQHSFTYDEETVYFTPLYRLQPPHKVLCKRTQNWG